MNRMALSRSAVAAGVVAALLLAQAGALPAAAAKKAPRNDAFRKASVVEELPFQEAKVKLGRASREPKEPRAGCANMAHSVWYRLSPEVSGDIVVVARTTQGARNPVRFQVAAYEGEDILELRQLGCLATAEDDLGSGIRLTVPVTAGETYLLQVGGPVELPGKAVIDLTISAPQAIDFGPLPALDLASPPLELAATADSGLPVTFTASGACTLEGNTLSVTGLGTCTVTASQAGDELWAAAADVAVNVEIGRFPQVITFEAPVEVPDNARPMGLQATSDSGLPVTFTAVGDCRIVGNQLYFGPAGSCTVTASQAGDDRFAPAELVRVIAIAKAPQAITFAPLPEALLGAEPMALAATADSGLTVTYAASGACSVDGTTLTLIEAGTCTVTASQPGEGRWLPATDVTVSFEVIGPVTGTVDLSGQVATAVPGSLVGPGAQVSSLLDPARRPEEHFVISLGLGDTLRVSATGEGRTPVVSVAYPDALTVATPGEVEWFDMPAEGWLASEGGLYSVRVSDPAGGSGAYRYTVGFEVEPGA